MEKWIRKQVGYLERIGKELANVHLNMTGPGTGQWRECKYRRQGDEGENVGAGVLLCVFGAAQWARQVSSV